MSKRKFVSEGAPEVLIYSQAFAFPVEMGGFFTPGHLPEIKQKRQVGGNGL